MEAGGAAEHGALAVAGQGYVSGGGELHVAAFLQVSGEAGGHDVARRRGFGIGNFRRGVHAGEQRRFGDGGSGGMRHAAIHGGLQRLHLARTNSLGVAGVSHGEQRGEQQSRHCRSKIHFHP